jgi:biotin carboxyl carrier protein
LTLGNRLLEVLVAEDAQGFNLQIGSAAYEVETVRRRRTSRGEQDEFVDGRWTLRAPLTGVVVEVRVAAGDSVAQGDVLFVVEAMKMLNELRARVAGEVTGVYANERDRVEIGARLVEVSAVEAS